MYYSIELAEGLLVKDKAYYENSNKLTVNDLLKRIENGMW